MTGGDQQGVSRSGDLAESQPQSKPATPLPRDNPRPIEKLSPDPRPNIVLINLDDADYQMLSPEMLQHYPGFNALASRSIRFTNMHVTTPFCGPSRASLFRGQYAHRTGVRINIPESDLSLDFKGGYSEFLRQGHDHDELGVWLKRGGYRTVMTGKYHHNGFDFKKPDGYDDFYVTCGGRYHGAYEFTTRAEKRGKCSHHEEHTYRTDQEAKDAVRIVRQHAQRRKQQTKSGEVAQPLFFYYAPLAPHRPMGHDFTKMVNKAVYGDWNPDLKIPLTPNFNEVDLSDKPPQRQSPTYTEREIAVLHAEYRSRARALKSVDDYMIKLVEALKETQQYENTYFLITSDNGYQLGQHRLHSKLDPYEMSTRATMLVCGPQIEPTVANHLLAHIDLCPTILELAECPKPDFLDGKSFAPLFRDPESVEPADWREPVVLENWQVKRNRRLALNGAYSGLRYYDKLYIEWADGDREFYDLANDPWELENAYDGLDEITQRKMHADLLASRNAEMDPILTLMPRPILSAHQAFPYCVRGMAEDDRGIKRIEVMVRHLNHGYWNGDGFQPARTRVSVSDFLSDQQIVSWRYDIREFISRLSEGDTEIIDGRKVFRIVLQAFAWDQQDHQSCEARIQLFVPYTNDPWAKPSITAARPRVIR